MNLNPNEHKLLLEMIQHDIINNDVLEALIKMKKDKINEVHHYKITEPNKSVTRWQTYLKDEENGRKKIVAPTEKELYKKLYDFYFPHEGITVNDLFPKWIEKRRLQNLSDRTIRRNINYWNKYYVGHSIIKKKMTTITFEEIEEFFHLMIRKYDLTVKDLNNMKIVLVDIFKMAVRRKIINENPFKYVELNASCCRPPVKKTDAERIFLHDEKILFFEELNKDLQYRPSITDGFAIFLLFKLGLRIGEVVALKFSDVNYKHSEIHIHRMETKVEDKKGKLVISVVNHTKKKSTSGDRFLPISEYELNLITKVIEINKQYQYFDDDFIFCDENGRTPASALDCLIRKLTRKANINDKSAHDIRRTVASEMFNNGVPIEVVRDYLGHSIIETTWGYIYNNLGKKNTSSMIHESLSSMSGFEVPVLNCSQIDEIKKPREPCK